jgi:hypothetical protein
MINTVEDARRFVSFTKFPPQGDRSWGPHPALTLSGLTFPQYFHGANGFTLNFAMIETRQALDAVDDILAVDGIDALFIGPSDLSIGLSGGGSVAPEGAEVDRAIDHALTRARAAAEDWSGGTRIGAALAQLNREHGRRIGRGSVVVVLSDGWDRGDPEELSSEIARLRRCAHRVVWLNPLAADPRYEPLTRGMQAALPHLDRLLPGNSIASLEALAELMEEGVS